MRNLDHFRGGIELNNAKWEAALAKWKGGGTSKFDGGMVYLPEVPGPSDGVPNVELAKLWNDERKFIEDLLNKRITYLFTVFGATIAGVLASRDYWVADGVLLIGLLACVLLARGIKRGFTKSSFMISALLAYEYPPVLAAIVYFDKKRQDPRTGGHDALRLTSIVLPRWLIVVLVLLFLACSIAGIKELPWPGTNTSSQVHVYFWPLRPF